MDEFHLAASLSASSAVNAGLLSQCHDLLGNLNRTEHILNYTCAFPEITSQNVPREKGLFDNSLCPIDVALSPVYCNSDVHGKCFRGAVLSPSVLKQKFSQILFLSCSEQFFSAYVENIFPAYL